ncbi:unnamed protein product, partial [Pleuronectes platessa]
MSQFSSRARRTKSARVDCLPGHPRRICKHRDMVCTKASRTVDKARYKAYASRCFPIEWHRCYGPPRQNIYPSTCYKLDDDRAYADVFLGWARASRSPESGGLLNPAPWDEPGLKAVERWGSEPVYRGLARQQYTPRHAPPATDAAAQPLSSLAGA